MTVIQEQAPATPGQALPANVDVPVEERYQASEILSVAVAHGAHDTYFAFLPTILPLLIQNLALSTAQAGLLTAFSQIPNLLQPLIGYLADRRNLKILVVLAPTFSGALLTLVGVAPSFGAAALLLLLAGFSTAGFHSIAPAMVSARSGHQVGRGMGFFMVGGELGYGLGPLMVVASIGVLTLRGLPWLMTLGMLASVILFFRLRNVSTVRNVYAEPSLPARQALLEMRPLMLPIFGALFTSAFLLANAVTYLPTFMTLEGAPFAVAGAALTVIQIGGTLGVFLMGLLSDRVGPRTIAVGGTLLSVGFALAFLFSQGWLQMVMLAGIGLTGFVANPSFLTIIQTHFSKNRSLANGVYMSGSFVLRSLVVVLVGFLVDQFGMRPVFMGSALASLLAVPLILLLPQRNL